MALPPPQLAAAPRSLRHWRSYAIALLALWLARAALVLSQGDVFGYEEFAKAELGRAMFDGLGIEHHRLAYHYYEVGGFVFSHLDALFFALFGTSVLTVKAVALAWHSLMLVVFMQLARAAYGRRAQALAALLFVLAPASLQKLSLLALGIHFESLLFHAWILLCAGRIAIEGSTRARDPFVLGLACGLGATFNLTTLAASAAAVLALLVRARSSLGGSRWAWLAGGALLGLAPWLWMAWCVGPAILDLHGERLWSGSGSGRQLERLSAFASVLWRDRPLIDRVDLLARGALFVGGLALLLRGGRQVGWTRLLLAHLSVFVVASLASGLIVGRVTHFNEFHRPSPAWLAITIVSAGALAHALEHASAARRRMAAAAVALLALLGLRSLAVALGPVPLSRWGESAAVLASTRACGIGECVDYLYYHLEGGRDERAAVLQRLREPPPAILKAKIAATLAAREVLDVASGLALARQLGGESWREYALGLGDVLFHATDWDCTRLPQVLAPYDGAERDVLFEAAGRGPFLGLQMKRLEEDVELGLREGFPESWFVGLGWRMAHLHLVSARAPYHLMQPLHPGYDAEAARAFLACQPESVRGALERGWLDALRSLRFEGASIP